MTILRMEYIGIEGTSFSGQTVFSVCIVTYLSHTQTASENSELEDGTMGYEASWWLHLPSGYD